VTSRASASWSWSRGSSRSHSPTRCSTERRSRNVTRVWVGGEPPDPPSDGNAESLDAWRQHVNEQLQPLNEAVNAATGRPRAALWRGARDRIAGAIVWIAQTTGREQRAAELTHRVYPAAEVREFDGSVLHVREGCCIYYRIPDAIKCWGCPLLSDDERRALQAT
jgi:ferric iron reductase protein FhuF